MLAGEGILVHVVGDPQVEQPVLLGDQQRRLPRQFLPLGAGVLLGVPRLRGQDHAEPVADFRVLHLHSAEEFEHLPVQFGFRHPDAGMAWRGVAAAPVIDVPAVAGRLESLHHLFAGDGPAAVPAGHELAGEGHLMGVVNVTAEERLHAVPGGTFDERLLPARIPLPLERNLSDVRPVGEHRVQLAPREARSIGPIRHAVGVQPIPKPIERQRLIGVEVEDALDVLRRGRLDFRDAAAVTPDVLIAVRRLADEPAFLDTTGEALFDIERLLLGVERAHVRQRPPHHAAGRRVLRRLRDGDERKSVLAFEAFEFNVVEEIAGGAIHLVEQQPVEFLRVFLAVGDQFAERLALITLARRFSDLEQPDNLAAGGQGVPLESLFLDREREALAFLFPTADPCQGDEAFHGAYSRDRSSNNHPAFWTIVIASSGESGLP